MTAAMFCFSVQREFPPLDPLLGTKRIHAGVVVSNPVEERDRLVFTVRLIDPQSRRMLPYRMRVYAESLGYFPRHGDLVALNGSVRIPSPARNPGGFSSRQFLRRKGIHYLMYTSPGGVHSMGHSLVSPFRQLILSPLQALCVSTVQQHLAKPHSCLLLGLTVGQRGDIPEEIRTIFSDAGIIHILAVSGLHVGILSFFLIMVFRSLRMRFGTALAMTCMLMVLYALLVDLRAPVVRATIMFVFIMLGLLMQRRILPVNIIACSAVLILAFRPQDIFDAGFQLSYAATFSIVIFHQRIRAGFPGWMRAQRTVDRFLVVPFSVSLAAQLGTAPVVAFHFFRCSLVAPLSNIVMVPFVFLAIPAGLVMIAAGVIHPLLGRICAGASWCFLSCIMRLSDVLASIPYSAVWVRRPGALFFFLYYATLLALVVARRKRRIAALCVMLLIAVNVTLATKLWTALHPRMRVHFLDVSQGDAIVLELPDRNVVVVDGGTRNVFVDYGDRVLLPFLRSKGIRKVHTVVITHPDADHYGGLLSLLEHMEVGCLLVNGEQKATMLYRLLLESAADKGVPVFRIHRGQVVHVGRTAFYVLHPPYDQARRSRSSNERSIVLKCGYGMESFLLTGDYTGPLVPIPSRRLAASVLKLPHHGAPLAGVHPLLSHVEPRIAVISVGRGNPFGHPDALVRNALRSQGITVFRTDVHGAISIGTDGRRLFTRTTIR